MIAAHVVRGVTRIQNCAHHKRQAADRSLLPAHITKRRWLKRRTPIREKGTPNDGLIRQFTAQTDYTGPALGEV